MIVKELTLIYDINLTILNDTVALIVYGSTSTIPKDTISLARVICQCLVVHESRFRNRQVLRIIDKDRTTCDSLTIFEDRFANEILSILIRSLFGDLCLLNKDGTTLSALDVFKL